MNADKMQDDYLKFRNNFCMTNKTVYSGVLYKGAHVCPYYDISKQKCELNACIRRGQE